LIRLRDLLPEGLYVGRLNHADWYPAHTAAALTWTLEGDYVPIYPKSIEKVVGKKIPVRAFHVTNVTHIPKMKSVIGSKKTISAFTETGKNSNLAKGRGVQTHGGGVIFFIEGHMLAQKYEDFNTVPDRTGRRWVQGFYVFGEGDLMEKAAYKAGCLDGQQWRDMENRVHDKVLDDYPDLDYRKQMEKVKEKLGKSAARQIRIYIDEANKLLKKHKDKVLKQIINPSDKTSSWWNEMLIYDTKPIEVFVLDRIAKDYYFKEEYQKELEKIVPKSKITYGTPAQFRKWYTAREGKIIDKQ
tara:strand:+ start:815 stop:1711 length:897 start_codon:yes stop_codon:yes gene_type:complete